jgi:hypothetical protein
MSCGASGIRVGMSPRLIGIKVKASKVEVDGLAKPLAAAKARGTIVVMDRGYVSRGCRFSSRG